MLSKMKGYSEAKAILGDFDLAECEWVLTDAHWQQHAVFTVSGTLLLTLIVYDRQPSYLLKMKFDGVRDLLLDNRAGREPEDFVVKWIGDLGWEDTSWEIGDGYSLEFFAKSAEILGVEEADPSFPNNL